MTGIILLNIWLSGNLKKITHNIQASFGCEKSSQEVLNKNQDRSFGVILKLFIIIERFWVISESSGTILYSSRIIMESSETI